MRGLIRSLFGPLGVLSPSPAGVVADRSSNFGLDAFRLAGNVYSQTRVDITTAGTNSTLTALQAIRGLIIMAAGASGGFTITLPSTSSIFALLGPTILTDGLFGWPMTFVNIAVGQTGTLTVGDASTTLSGTATIATNTVRDFYCQVTAAGTLTIVNCGSKSL